MRIRYVSLLLVRDPMAKINKVVPAWEVPMLREVYGQGQIEDEQETVVDAPEPVPPDVEMARLIKHYGREKRGDGSTGETFASLAYGRGDAGVRALEKLMREAIVDLPAPKKAA